MSLSVWLSLTCSVSVPRQTNRREKLFSCFISVCGLRDGWQSYRSPSCAIRLRRVGLVITFVSQVFRAAIRLCAVYWWDLCLSLCRLPFGSAPCTDEICVSVVCHSTVHRVLMTFVSLSFGVPFDCAPCTDDICISVFRCAIRLCTVYWWHLCLCLSVCHSTLHRVLMTFLTLSFGLPFDWAPFSDLLWSECMLMWKKEPTLTMKLYNGCEITQMTQLRERTKFFLFLFTVQDAISPVSADIATSRWSSRMARSIAYLCFAVAAGKQLHA